MSSLIQPNLLCYGDNLDFLTDTTLLPNESVDLIYLDPPFNSQQNYNVLFKETSGTPETAQIKAFEDTWKWDLAANTALTRIHTDAAVPAPLVDLMKTFMNFLKASPMMAYLVQMSIRLVHMHRVLKPTGSLYLHCDPTASHYLKLVLDAIFEPKNFRNEIVWKRASTVKGNFGQGSKLWGQATDAILFYSKTDDYTFNQPFLSYSDEYVNNAYRHVEPRTGRRYRLVSMIGPGGASKGNPHYEFLGVTRYWRYSRTRMQELYDKGLIVQTKPGTVPNRKYYLDEGKGVPVQSLWDDIGNLQASHAERMGYPTQKPLELLKRIISASSNPGDVILDPFCGCGTTIDAVETLNREATCEPRAEASGHLQEPRPDNREADRSLPVAARPVPRRWIGIDVTHLSINLIKHRLTRFTPPPVYEVVGEPASTSGAEALAQLDPYQFQFWALGLVGARPIGGTKKKGADRGIDGVRYFVDEVQNNAPVSKRMLVQVKSGHVKVGDVRDLVGTLSREGAEMGVFLTLEEPTGAMKSEAATAGMYTSPWDKKPYPKVQLLTIAELLADSYRPNPRCLQIPGGVVGPSATLPEAPKHKGKKSRQATLGFDQGNP